MCNVIVVLWLLNGTIRHDNHHLLLADLLAICHVCPFISIEIGDRRYIMEEK